MMHCRVRVKWLGSEIPYFV